MGGGWNNTGVVAFLYINNCRTFPVGLEELSRKSESLKIRRRENPGRGRVGSDRDGEGPSRPRRDRAAGGLLRPPAHGQFPGVARVSAALTAGRRETDGPLNATAAAPADTGPDAMTAVYEQCGGR